MRRPFTIYAWILGLFIICEVHAAQFRFATQTFTVPDGFEMEQVAGPPLIERPISGSFDEQGRLYITDSSGSNDKVDKQLAEKPHRVVRLEPADRDGRFHLCLCLCRDARLSDQNYFAHRVDPGCGWYLV